MKKRLMQFGLVLSVVMCLVQSPRSADTTPASPKPSTAERILKAMQQYAYPQGGNPFGMNPQAIQAQFSACAKLTEDAKKASSAASSSGAEGCGTKVPEITESTEAPSCDELKGTNGNFSQTKFDEARRGFECAAKSAGNKLASINKLNGEFTCLQQNADALNKSMQQAAAQYDMNRQKVNQDFQKYNQFIQQQEKESQERTDQLGQVGQKLNGSSASGEVGLLAIREEVTNMISALATDTSRVTEDVHGNIQAIKVRDQAILDLKARETVKCVASPMANSRCSDFLSKSQIDPGIKAGSVGLEQFVKCRFAEQMAAQRKITDSNRNSRLKEISTYYTDMSNTMAQVFNDLNSEITSKNITAVESRYAAKLDDIGQRSGLPIRNQIFSQYRSCLGGAQIAQALKLDTASLKDGSIGKMNADIAKTDRAISLAIEEAARKSGTTYEKAKRAINGTYRPMDTSYCNVANARSNEQKAGACLQYLRTNLEDLLKGQSRQGQVSTPAASIQFKAATQPQLMIGVACLGLNDCITKLQYVSNELVKDIQARKLQTEETKKAKDSYRNTVKSNITSFINQVSQSLAPQKEWLQNYFNDLQSKFVGLGIDKEIFPEDMESTETVDDLMDEKSDVLKSPKNILEMIGASGTPPMKKIDAKYIAQVRAALGDAFAKNEMKKSTAEGIVSKMDQKRRTCFYGAVRESLSDLQTKWLSNCIYETAMCNKSDRNTEILSNIAAVFDFTDTDVVRTNAGDVVGLLNTGIDGLCSQGRSAQSVARECCKQLQNIPEAKSGLGISNCDGIASKEMTTLKPFFQNLTSEQKTKASTCNSLKESVDSMACSEIEEKLMKGTETGYRQTSDGGSGSGTVSH